MHFERLTSADDPRFSAAMEGYAVSFPPHEQREPASQRAIMTDPAYRFNLIYNGGAPVGAMLYWETETFIYVEHFFILPHLLPNPVFGVFLAEPVSDILAAATTTITFFARFDKILDAGAAKV